MAHELSITADGQAEAFFALTPAWHGLGTVVDEAPSSAEAIKLARLEWEVMQQPIYTDSAQQTLAGGPDKAKVAGWTANVRKDTGEVLGVVTDRYKPVQNVEAFSFCDGLLADGIIRYESAGAMRGGKIIWLLAQMPGRTDEVAEGDTLRRFILFVNSHDGSRAALVLPTSVRVVCMNTLRLALGKGRANALRIRHTGEIDGKLDAARQAVGLVNSMFDANLGTARKLASRRLVHNDFIAYIDRLMPLGETDSERAKKHRQEVRAKIKRNFYSDHRQQLGAIRQSAWAAFNSVTQFVDHQAERRGGTTKQRAENGFCSVTLGAGHEAKQEAWNAAVEMFVGA
jgi:phage/plasmid-like protein (TIGR03299 family)